MVVVISGSAGTAVTLVESLSNEDGERQRERYKNSRLSYRIQSLHVGMRPPGHFSAVVFKKPTEREKLNSRVL